MPDPKKLKVGDRIKFVSLPDEWQDQEFTIHEDDVEFMKIMIARNWPSRVYEIDEYGKPWIYARVRSEDGWEHHTWGICEKTGWRIVRKRG
ncbi:MAG: hypothetical protein JW888_09000 [Pirellulales bacterium]|nr:hypothetical protein [Pirellulales bacterium]